MKLSTLRGDGFQEKSVIRALTHAREAAVSSDVPQIIGGLRMRIRTIFAALVVAIAVVGCTTAPIMNVDDAAVAVPSGKSVTSDQVRTAVIRAGSALGWQIKDESPNVLVGTLVLRKHTAVVEIPYSATTFSIKYRSSINLDEQGGMIHKNYNGWIQNLTRGINTQLSLL